MKLLYQFDTLCNILAEAMLSTYISSPMVGIWHLQGCAVATHVSTEASVRRPETRYVSVHWASKGRAASMVSFHSHLIEKWFC